MYSNKTPALARPGRHFDRQHHNSLFLLGFIRLWLLLTQLMTFASGSVINLFMVELHSLCTFLDSLLQPDSYVDFGINGLQVEASAGLANSAVSRIGFAVDSGMSVIERAIAEDCQLLVVHHGLFWGSVGPVTGIMASKVASLIRKNCSLYAAHLPLDGNHEVGNAFELARYLNLEECQGFMEYEGRTVGVRAICPRKRQIDDFLEPLSQIEGAVSPVIMPFGSKDIRSVAIVTGSGSSAIPLCNQPGGEQIDLLISGEPKHESYHQAKEHKVNAIFAGHYATETFGIRALKSKLESTFDIETVYISEPTGI